MGVPDKEWDETKSRIDSVSVHSSEEYKSFCGDFAKKAANFEVAMYTPFANMANLILGCHRDVSSQRIKVLPFSGDHVISGGHIKRKPDVALIPEKDGNEELIMENVRWPHVLLPIEFKKNSEKEKEKEKGWKGEKDEASVELDGVRRPAKRVHQALQGRQQQQRLTLRQAMRIAHLVPEK